MKTLRYKYWIIGLLLLFTAGAVGAQERTKKVNKTYSVGSAIELSLLNKYGKIHVESWDRNQIDVEITIRADMRNESRTQEFLDKVDIDITETSSMLEFRTRIDGNLNTKNGEEFSIDYEIRMPKVNPLSAKLSYGDMYLDDLDGELNIDLAYGNLKGDVLRGDFTIDMAYSNAEVDELGSGTLDIAYSNLRSDKIGNMDVDNRYSNIVSGSNRDINADMRYGTLKIGSAASVDVDSRYSSTEIQYLEKSLTADMQYGGGVTVEKISKNFSRIEIDGGYAGAELNFEAGTNATIEGKFRYGGLKYDDGDIEFTERISENNSSSYRGKIGNGNGGTIKLEASYASVRIRVD